MTAASRRGSRGFDEVMIVNPHDPSRDPRSTVTLGSYSLAESLGGVESLVAHLVEAPVEECCERGEHPRCCFEISPAHAGEPVTGHEGVRIT